MEQHEQTHLLVVGTLYSADVDDEGAKEQSYCIEEMDYELEHSHEKALQSQRHHFQQHRHYWILVEIKKHQLQGLVENHHHNGGVLQHILRTLFNQEYQHADQNEVGTADDLQIGSFSNAREDLVHEEQAEPEQGISNQVFGRELLIIEAEFEFQIKVEKENERGSGLVHQETGDQDEQFVVLDCLNGFLEVIHEIHLIWELVFLFD